MKKSVLCILLALALLIGSFGLTASALNGDVAVSSQEALLEVSQPHTKTVSSVGSTDNSEDLSEEYYPLWVGGVQVTGKNAAHITADTITGDVSYNAASHTLTLNNAVIDGGGWWDYKSDRYSGYSYGAAIISDIDLTINVIGSNEVKFVRFSYTDLSEAIYMSSCNLTFTGSGSIDLTGFECSVKEAGTLTVDKDCTVSMHADKKHSYLHCKTVEVGSLIVNGTLSVYSNAQYTTSTAVYADSLDVGASGQLSAFGKVTSNTSSDAYSVYLTGGDMNIRGKVVAGEITNNSFGVYTTNNGKINIWDTGCLTAKGGKAAVQSSVVLESDALKISAGEDENSAERITLNSLKSQKYVSISAQSEEPTEPPVLLGDADGNGEVDLVDATVIQRHTTMIAVPYDEAQLMCADIDDDGSLTIVDATFIQRYATKVQTPYKIGATVG